MGHLRGGVHIDVRGVRHHPPEQRDVHRMTGVRRLAGAGLVLLALEELLQLARTLRPA